MLFGITIHSLLVEIGIAIVIVGFLVVVLGSARGIKTKEFREVSLDPVAYVIGMVIAGVGAFIALSQCI